MTVYVEYRGETVSLRQLSEISGTPRPMLWHRLRDGWSVEDAAEKPKQISGPKERSFEYMGETKTVSEWAEYTGMNRGTIVSRLHRGVPIGDVLTAPHNHQFREKKPYKKSPRPEIHLPDGCYWESRYRIACPDGTVLDGGKRVGRRHFPRPLEWGCQDCGVKGYLDLAKYRQQPKRCKKCNALAGSKARVEVLTLERERLGIETHNGRRKNRDHKHIRRCRKYGCEYQPGINARELAKRFGYTCQECFITLQPHTGGFHPEGWTVGHIMPLSKGGPHTWDNVQAECLACNMWKRNDKAYIDWDKLMEGHA